MYEHPQFSFYFPFFFFGFGFLLQFTSFMVQIRLGQGLGAEHEPTEHSHHKLFLFQLRVSQATAWHHRPGSFHPLQESQSCRSRAARGEEEEEGPLPHGPLRPVTPRCGFGPRTRICFVRSRSHPWQDQSWAT